jgi:UDP-N-acetyl-D-mannosaminuronic acid dehydrogenase
VTESSQSLIDVRVGVIGLGYVGLPTASMFATRGLTVVGVDTNEAMIDRLLEGDVENLEPDVQSLALAALNSGKLRVSSAIEECDAYVVAVPTPVGPDHKADLTYVRTAIAALRPHLVKGSLVILESTVPPGTTENVIVPELEMSGLRAGPDILVAHCPERVLPGSTLVELVNNDRVVGGINRESGERAAALYRTFVRGRIHITDATTAELVKVMENTYRDVNIALANEFALVAQRLGVDVWEAIELANNHPRVSILKPGPGVGGHCIAVDPWFLVELTQDDTTVIRSARERNDSMPRLVVERLLANAPALGTHVAVLGLAYRAGLGDTRESPALRVIKELESRGVEVKAHDPYVVSQAGIDVVTLEEALDNASAILVITDHSEFRNLDPDRAAAAVANRILFDTRNCLPREAWERAGFTVLTVGRG